MALTPGMKRRGYVESDGYSDTHGFRRTDDKVWVTFFGDPDHWCKRWVWVDYLGDWYVSDYDGERFERLTGGSEVCSWEWADERWPMVPPHMMERSTA